MLAVYEVEWVSKSRGFKGGEMTMRDRILSSSAKRAIAFVKEENGIDVKKIIASFREQKGGKDDVR